MRRWWEKITKEETFPFISLLSEVHGVPVLRVSRDVILASGEQFRAALKQAVDGVERTEGTGRVLVVDLSELSYLDSTGLRILMQETADLRKRGGEVRLVIPPGGRVGRILGVTGVGEMFPIYSDVPRATEERRGGPTP
jgi:anti-sigma B factor antagonist